jgi:hypothetical protein
MTAFELAARHGNRELAEFHLRRMRALNADAEDVLVACFAPRGIAAFEELLANIASGDYDY